MHVVPSHSNAQTMVAGSTDPSADLPSSGASAVGVPPIPLALLRMPNSEPARGNSEIVKTTQPFPAEFYACWFFFFGAISHGVQTKFRGSRQWHYATARVS